MNEEKLWLKFIISGKAQDYLRYIDAKSQTQKGVDCYSLFNRCVSDKGEHHR